MSVLLAVLLMGAMLVASAFTSRVHRTILGAGRAMQRASGAAELGAWIGLAALDSLSLEERTAAEWTAQIHLPGVDIARAALVRLTEATYLAHGEAGVRGPGGRLIWRGVGVFAASLGDSLTGFRLEPLPDRSWVELP